MIEQVNFSTVEDAAAALAKDLAAGLRRALNDRGRAALAVSGGITPTLVYPFLCANALDWDRITVTLTDERWVAADHGDSNEHLTRTRLMVLEAANARLVGLKTPAEDPADAVDEVEKRLGTMDWPLDGVFLGMGADGHVASLFPGRSGVESLSGRVVAVPSGDGRGSRMSLTPKALLDARRIYLVVAGKEKRAAFEAARIPGPAENLPLRFILGQAQTPVSVYHAP